MIPGIDLAKFKGFAVKNDSGEDVSLIIDNDAAPRREILLKPREVVYNYVGDVVRIYPNWFLRTCQGGKQVSRTEIIVSDGSGVGGVKQK